MKIGIITDVHNNLIALKVIIAQFNQRKCDKIICCGDIIGIGPYPEQTVQYMMKIPNLSAVRGNHDRYLIEGMPTEYPNDEGMDYEEMMHHKWEHSMLSEKSSDFLKRLPNCIEIVLENRKITIMHYCMDENQYYVDYTPNPSENDLSRMFSNVDSDIILFGHDHNKTICHNNNKWYINVGSLGCPAKDRNLTRAGILTITQDEMKIEPIEMVYDADRVVHEINKLNYPAASDIKKIFFGIC